MLKEKIYKSDFLKYTLVLISGTVIAQITPLLLQPILRRIFSPEEFGIAAVYLSLLSILTIISSLNYHPSIILPKKDEDSNYLVIGSLIITLFFSTTIFILILFFNEFFIQILNLPLKIKGWLFLLPISIIINSAHLIFSNWLTRKKEFKRISINKISRRFSEGISQITFGKLMNFPGAIIMGSFIGDSLNFILYLFQFKRTKGTFKLDFKKIKINLINYIHFPKYNLLTNLFSITSLFIPVLIVNNLFDVEIAGQFDLSRQILAVPISLISLSISQVFLENITSKKKNKESFIFFYKKILMYLTIMAIIGVLVIFLYGFELFVFIFGQNWSTAGEISSILIFSYAIKFVISPLAISFIALEELKINGVWQFCYFVAIMILYFLNDLNFETFLKVYVLIDLISYSIYGLLTYFIIRKYEKKIVL